MNWHGFDKEGKRTVIGAAKNKTDLRDKLIKGGLAVKYDLGYIRFGRYGYTIDDIYAGRSGVRTQGVC